MMAVHEHGTPSVIADVGDDDYCDICRPDAAPPKKIMNSEEFERHVWYKDEPQLMRKSSPPTDAAQPVAWLAEDYRFTPKQRSLHFEKKTANAHSTFNPTALYAHPEDALKQTPETFTESGSVKIEDAPGGPYSTAYTADNPKLWIVLRKGDTEERRDWVFHGTEKQAIGVRDVLNRLKGAAPTTGETDG